MTEKTLREEANLVVRLRPEEAERIRASAKDNERSVAAEIAGGGALLPGEDGSCGMTHLAQLDAAVSESGGLLGSYLQGLRSGGGQDRGSWSLADCQSGEGTA